MDLALVQALEQSGEPHLKGAFQEYPDCGDEICFDTVGLKILRQQYPEPEKCFKSIIAQVII